MLPGVIRAIKLNEELQDWSILFKEIYAPQELVGVAESEEYANSESKKRWVNEEEDLRKLIT